MARAVIAKPKLMLADEPTGNLHSAQGEEIMELFTQLNRQGTTIVQVTHSEKNASLRPPHRSSLQDGWIVSDVRLPIESLVEAQDGGESADRRPLALATDLAAT